MSEDGSDNDGSGDDDDSYDDGGGDDEQEDKELLVECGQRQVQDTTGWQAVKGLGGCLLGVIMQLLAALMCSLVVQTR